LSMSIGTLIFAIAMIDRLIGIIVYGFDESSDQQNAVGPSR